MTIEPAIVAAQESRAAALRILARIAAEHLVDVKAMTGNHPARQKAHVVMARCHAAQELREAGFEWKPIARLLGMRGHPLAIRSARRWRELCAAPRQAAGDEQSATQIVRRAGA
jgi:hypothetical protein